MMDADTDRRIRDSIEVNGRVDIIDRYSRGIGGAVTFGLLIFSITFILCVITRIVLGV